jgi:hypothetical protein
VELPLLVVQHPVLGAGRLPFKKNSVPLDPLSHEEKFFLSMEDVNEKFLPPQNKEF